MTFTLTFCDVKKNLCSFDQNFEVLFVSYIKKNFSYTNAPKIFSSTRNHATSLSELTGSIFFDRNFFRTRILNKKYVIV